MLQLATVTSSYFCYNWSQSLLHISVTTGHNHFFIFMLQLVTITSSNFCYNWPQSLLHISVTTGHNHFFIFLLKLATITSSYFCYNWSQSILHISVTTGHNHFFIFLLQLATITSSDLFGPSFLIVFIFFQPEQPLNKQENYATIFTSFFNRPITLSCSRCPLLDSKHGSRLPSQSHCTNSAPIHQEWN